MMATRYLNFIHVPNTLAIAAALLAAASFFLSPDKGNAVAEARPTKPESAAAIRNSGGAVLDLRLLLLLRSGGE